MAAGDRIEAGTSWLMALTGESITVHGRAKSPGLVPT